MELVFYIVESKYLNKLNWKLTICNFSRLLEIRFWRIYVISLWQCYRIFFFNIDKYVNRM